METETELAKYLHELGQLKRAQRSGWWLAGIRDAESVAQHSFRSPRQAYSIRGRLRRRASPPVNIIVILLILGGVPPGRRRKWPLETIRWASGDAEWTPR